MEDLLLVLCSVFAGFVMGYFRGVVSGYHTKVRDEDKSSVLPIKIFKEKDQFLFYDMNLNQFLHQSTNLQEGIDFILEEFDDKTVVVIKDESV